MASMAMSNIGCFWRQMMREQPWRRFGRRSNRDGRFAVQVAITCHRAHMISRGMRGRRYRNLINVRGRTAMLSLRQIVPRRAFIFRARCAGEGSKVWGLQAGTARVPRANFRKIRKLFLSSHAHAFDRDRSAPAAASSFTGPFAGEKPERRSADGLVLRKQQPPPWSLTPGHHRAQIELSAFRGSSDVLRHVAWAAWVASDPQRHRRANFCRDAQCGTRPGKFNDGGKSGGLLPIIDEVMVNGWPAMVFPSASVNGRDAHRLSVCATAMRYDERSAFDASLD
jgi:hypothetical protein